MHSPTPPPSQPWSHFTEVFREISFDPHSTFGPHSHHRVEVNYVKRGTCTITTDTICRHFGRGDIMVIPSGVRHYFEVGQHSTALIQLEFRPEIFALIPGLPPSEAMRLPEFLTDSGSTVMAIRSDIRIKSVMRNIIWELHNQAHGYPTVLAALYTQLWILLSRAHADAEERRALKPAIAPLVSLIRREACKPVTINDIAAAAGISSRYMRKLFRQQFDITPGTYLSRCRIDTAKEMLANTDMSIKEVAYACGFTSPRHFVSVFKRLEGIAPFSAFN